MIEPKQAAVRPRVVVPGLGSTVLEDEVRARLERGWAGLIVLAGNRGSGRSTALAHLASVVGNHARLVLVDGEPEDAIESARTNLVICTAPINYMPREIWRLVAWTRDDCIEYLLGSHRERCASVMQRVASEPLPLALPAVWQPVLDRMAEDESLTSVAAALRTDVESRLSDRGALGSVSERCFEMVCHPGQKTVQESQLASDRRVGPEAIRLLRHEPVRRLLAADYLVASLRLSRRPMLQTLLPEQLVRDVAEQIRSDARVIVRLEGIMMGPKLGQHPMAASLLHAAGAEWIPEEGRTLLVPAAYLAGVRWSGIRLQKLDVVCTDLTAADLSESTLPRVVANNAVLEGANLHGAQLSDFRAARANLTNADLSYVRASQADFHSAILRGATLEGALLQHADFCSADLKEARFTRANLQAARFVGAMLDDADFTGADLSRALLNRLPLKRTRLAGALFDHARLYCADLEGMVLPGGSFVGADLREATLTGSRITGGQFQGTKLHGAKLAEIEWERADLRDADLSQCTFHLGSSRSGLVGSPIASEGSRTGFYTDEHQEQGFKTPEEIRKANLRGADLRGARIDDTDFYLVDLRDARYTSEQEEHFRRCRAILETRV